MFCVFLSESFNVFECVCVYVLICHKKSMVIFAAFGDHLSENQWVKYISLHSCCYVLEGGTCYVCLFTLQLIHIHKNTSTLIPKLLSKQTAIKMLLSGRVS